MLANCSECRTPAPFPDARFCVKCGSPFRQPCPTCHSWLLVGGNDLVHGRCPNCHVPLKVCSDPCGRIHGSSHSRCQCERKKVLPPLRSVWSTPRGPSSNTRCLSVIGIPSNAPKDEDVNYRSQRILGMIDTGIHLTTLTDQRIYRLRSDFQRGLQFTPKNDIIGINGVCYLIDEGILCSLDYSSESSVNELHVSELVTHAIGPDGWCGIDHNGNLVKDDGLEISRLTASEKWHVASGQYALCAATMDSFFFLEHGEKSEISGVEGEGRQLLFCQNEQFWQFRVTGAQGILERIDRKNGVAFQVRDVMSHIFTVIVSSESVAFLIPLEMEDQIQKVSLIDGRKESLEGARIGHARILDCVGIETPKGLRVLSAGVTGASGNAVMLDPESGATMTFQIQENLSRDWNWAQWLVQDESVFLAVNTDHSSAIFEFGC